MDEKRLDKIEQKLDAIVEAINTIAVQDERLKQLEKHVTTLWGKWDDFVVPHIAQCPKEQVKWLWWIVCPMGLSLLAIAVTLIAVVVR